ncbi:hypothetical protein SERLA73DRAFT_159962 [Serpula lacrymans var. lacrymans S7.3]|uniref:Zn(2)-C6 fungal-type domain-containing protein n=2 Tax=Serpula lacrymans var. lacrymans TaxID=341189 RepID=F8PVJ6_SERL3|nr:uncharacterized protein SERLADRAFT_414996 [Serpula lacrymans var. lacrymans S7.9]EGN99813.1 hypothetical protein SERLA73DRAFT_159962 [Serpula lacrymans var. lacrymans S7.3]EGO25383.1 hypothetical protein SERLADRAFT_414996 [Serpula lacrymans var. lacrymans S7.9]
MSPHLDDRLPPIQDNMADSIPYPAQSAYIPPAYYPPPQGHVHVVAPQQRQDSQQRKRPKYTRSKTGCLTCRVKKIKCDETKPNCMRCTHGQRDCTWPEGVPARKKATPRKDSVDGHPSNAESSGLSEASTPPTRDNTPPRRGPVDYGIPPMMARRHSEPYTQGPPIGSEPDMSRRQIPQQGYPMQLQHHQQNQNTHPNNVLSVIPEMSAYPPTQQPRYESAYTNPPLHSHSSHSSRIQPNQHTLGIRSMAHPPPLHHWNTNPSMVSNVDPLEPYFSTVQERNLIRHYCDNSLSFIMAIPSENPIVAANLPLIFNHPPGSDTSAEALRMALLGVAAIHRSFLLSQSGVNQGSAEEMLQLGHSFRMNSKQLLAKACATMEGAQSDASLATSMAIALMDIFSGGRNWSKNMDLAKTLVRIRGGPTSLLASSFNMKSGSPDQIARTRLLLEILAVYDVAACLANGEAPTVLNSTSNSWWLDESQANFSYVEQVFGMSRAFIPVLAEITSFVSRVLHGTARISEVIGEGSSSSSSIEADTTAQCHEYYSQLENWVDPRVDAPPRVHRGNRMYQKAAQILLLRDVLHASPVDPLVQACTDTILTLALECTSQKMGVDLIWPVIIAASHTYGSNRTRVAQVFEAFRFVQSLIYSYEVLKPLICHRTQCCYEIETSEQIVLQVWKRLDQGLPGADWRTVMKDSDLKVLIV